MLTSICVSKMFRTQFTQLREAGQLIYCCLSVVGPRRSQKTEKIPSPNLSLFPSSATVVPWCFFDFSFLDRHAVLEPPFWMFRLCYNYFDKLYAAAAVEFLYCCSVVHLCVCPKCVYAVVLCVQRVRTVVQCVLLYSMYTYTVRRTVCGQCVCTVVHSVCTAVCCSIRLVWENNAHTIRKESWTPILVNTDRQLMYPVLGHILSADI